MLRTAIVEDDPLSLEALKDQLSSFEDSLELVGEYHTVSEAIDGLKRVDIDLLLLDIELPDGNGFKVLEELNEINFEVVITTSHDRFMLKAIQHAALDYLMKPVRKADLMDAIERFHQRQDKYQKEHEASLNRRRLVIPDQEGLNLVDIEDIVRLESDGAYSHIFLDDGSRVVASKNIGHFEERLSHHHFSRVHHSHLVNLEKVKNFSHKDGGTLTLTDNSQVTVSRRKKDEVLRALGT
jgi:two-component system LytT family response regulator